MAVATVRARLGVGSVVLAAIAAAVAAPAASASPFDPSGVIKPATPRVHLNASTSDNWFGYNQGSISEGGKLFSSITGNWTVPKATQHTKGQAEDSATWIGIGGGCVDSSCTVTDNTLIQTGTEQDVSAGGGASYSAWWEIIPAPSETISGMKVSPGDHMSASIAAAEPEVWTITLKDVTKKESFTQTIPYPSSELTAEWIEETPTEISTSGTGLADLPNLTETPFSSATVNGANAHLNTSQEIDLVNSSGGVIGTPSSPTAGHNGFGACTWTTTCPVP